jgi:primosomal protein N' (replication factor Y)
MHYFYVWVRSNKYHGNDALTYSSSARLKTGSIVKIELQREVVLGVVVGPANQPRFKTKPVTAVLNLPPLPTHLIKLSQWLQSYYPAPVGILTQQLLIANLSQLDFPEKAASPLPAPNLADLPPLTSEQQAALENMAQRDSYLLHGTTGSGKTRLYIELAAKAVAANKSAIILTPEISLTSQLAANFQAVFGARVIVMHSQQAPAERRQAWLDCLRATEPVIVIGPRSALFCPVESLGLIVMDEAHEAAYKQEQAPQYQTGRVAATLAQLTRSTLVLGSATPAVTDYFIAEQKQKPIIELTTNAKQQRVISSEVQRSRETSSGKQQTGSLDSARDDNQVKVTTVDRKDHSLFNRSPYLSQTLLEAIEGSLSRGEQSLIYLNRRGTARLVLCQNCGWQANCPHCDVPLTYHGDSHELRCHSCSHHQSAPTTCPSCGHVDIIFKTAGTKALVDDIQRLFPSARLMRFDTDNTKAERFEQHYEAVKNGEVDILIGTQLLAKGLDLPKLSTLGVVLADTSLYLPDFSAQERTFQLLSQVLGRIGRGHVAGTAIIQSYHPDHPVLQQAIKGDYQTFYKAELAARQQFLFPPYCYLLKITVRRASSKAAETAAEKLKHDITTSGRKVRVEGPAPSFYERFQSKYQWQLVVKSKDRNELLKIIADLPANCSYDIDPADLL